MIDNDCVCLWALLESIHLPVRTARKHGWKQGSRSMELFSTGAVPRDKGILESMSCDGSVTMPTKAHSTKFV